MTGAQASPLAISVCKTRKILRLNSSRFPRKGLFALRAHGKRAACAPVRSAFFAKFSNHTTYFGKLSNDDFPRI
jgi:hypothetical protein